MRHGAEIEDVRLYCALIGAYAADLHCDDLPYVIDFQGSTNPYLYDVEFSLTHFQALLADESVSDQISWEDDLIIEGG